MPRQIFIGWKWLNYLLGIYYIHETVYFYQLTQPVEPDMNLIGVTLRPEVNDKEVSGLTNGRGLVVSAWNAGNDQEIDIPPAGKAIHNSCGYALLFISLAAVCCQIINFPVVRRLYPSFRR